MAKQPDNFVISFHAMTFLGKYFYGVLLLNVLLESNKQIFFTYFVS